MADDNQIPRVIMEASEIRKLPLTAADGYVLSRIDGRSTEKDLAGLTGLPPMQIRTSIDKLLALKVIAFGKAPVVAPSKPGLGGDAGSDPALPPAGEGEEANPEGPAANALLDKAIADIPETAPELAEPVDLPVDLRRRVMGLHSVITSLDHYAILTIQRDADKKTVKRAYFELAAVFHPDRYFRKNLGSFKQKMEVIFGKVSVAYETLADKDRRTEYDEYLGDVEKSRAVEAMLRNVMDEVAKAEKEAVELAGAAPPLPPDAAPAASAAPAAPAAPAPPPALSAADEQRRREALAKRLMGGRPSTRSPPLTAPTPPPAPPVARGNPQEAVEALRRRYEEKVESGRRAQGKKYMGLGETAESRNDLTAAAASYRVALTFLRPDDEGFAHANEIIAKSETQLGETYLRQADHEERANRWEDAAKSWGRAVKFRPEDHHANERYANALVRSSGDLHTAVQCAQKAIQLGPTVGDYRVTLANAYMAAGLTLNARRELESAATQFPENPNIPIALKKLAPKST